MKKIAKWLGVGLGALVVLVGGALGAVYAISSQDLDETYKVDPPDVKVPTDDKAIAWGKHILETRGCQDCHGERMQGKVIMDNPAMGTIAGTNLTPGKGSAVKKYTDEDWVRSIRHGVGPDGKPHIFMPSFEFAGMGAEDLGALIAYLKSLPPVDSAPPEVAPGPMARMLYLQGSLPILVPAKLVDHDAPMAKIPERGPTKEYGKYLAETCRGCHGSGFSGGKVPGMPPDHPVAANLTFHESGLKGWGKEDFMTTLRTGRTPEGKKLNPKFMPWTVTANLTDDEISALYAYFKSLEPTPEGNR